MTIQSLFNIITALAVLALSIGHILLQRQIDSLSRSIMLLLRLIDAKKYWDGEGADHEKD